MCFNKRLYFLYNAEKDSLSNRIYQSTEKSALISYILFKVLLELWPLCYDFRWCETITWGGLFITMPPLYFNLTKF